MRFWELGNEPDIGFGFVGPPSDYASWAGLAAEGIRAARPDATIVIGGFARVDGTYIKAALRDKKRPLIDRVDVANIHLRGTVRGVRAAFERTQAIYRRAGFAGPLWVTETGYPSRPEHQTQPGYQDGPRGQARWLRRALRAQVDLGAGAVFVTLRDNHEFPATSPFSQRGDRELAGRAPQAGLPGGPAARGDGAVRVRSRRARTRAGRARRACGSAACPAPRRGRTACACGSSRSRPR